MGDGRDSRAWKALRDRLKGELPPVCYLCGEDIDLRLSGRHPMGWTLDHVVPLVSGVFNPHDVANLRPAHMRCNSAKGVGAQPTNPVTSRKW